MESLCKEARAPATGNVCVCVRARLLPEGLCEKASLAATAAVSVHRHAAKCKDGGASTSSSPIGGVFAIGIMRQLSSRQIANAFRDTCDTFTSSSSPPSSQLLEATISGTVKHPH